MPIRAVDVHSAPQHNTTTATLYEYYADTICFGCGAALRCGRLLLRAASELADSSIKTSACVFVCECIINEYKVCNLITYSFLEMQLMLITFPIITKINICMTGF